MKIPTGSKILDKMLEGGYEKDVITTIYGPAGSGKTILVMLCCLNMARAGKKVIYIDTENSFSVERLKQIAKDYRKIMDNVVFLKPASFSEQKKAFENLRKIINDKIKKPIRCNPNKLFQAMPVYIRRRNFRYAIFTYVSNFFLRFHEICYPF